MLLFISPADKGAECRANNCEIGSAAFDEGRHGKTQLWLVGEQPEGSVKKG